MNFVPTHPHSGMPTLAPEDSLLGTPAANPIEFVVPRAIQVAVADSITQFDVAQWNGLVSRDEPQLRHDVLCAAEKSGMIRNPRYVSVERQGELVAVAVAASLPIDLLTLAAPKLQGFARKIRRGPLRNFLLLQSVSCGPIITNCRPNLYVSPDLTGTARAEVCAALIEAIDALPGGGLRVFFEHPLESADDLQNAFSANGYVRALSLPGTRLQIRWPDFEAYTAAMRKFYRRAVRHDQKAGAALEFCIERDFGHLAPEIHRLYLNVLARANTGFEDLSEAFFREMGGCEDARLVTARLKSSGELVGVELLLLGETGMQDLYTGINYDYNDECHLYFNLIYPGIALACESGYSRLTTGQTSYQFKSRLGVEVFDLFVFLKHRNPIINAILHRAHPLICPETETFRHHVFHDETVPEAAEAA